MIAVTISSLPLNWVFNLQKWDARRLTAQDVDPETGSESRISLMKPVYVDGCSRSAMSKLRIYGLSLAKSAAILLAVVGGGTAPIGLGFMTCMDINQKLSSYVNLWATDYCSGMVGLFLVITTAMFFYLGILTEFHVIPRSAGFLSIGIMGAIAFTYMISIVTAWN
jgi:hypothetical protein